MFRAKFIAASGFLIVFAGCAAPVEAPDTGSITDDLIESGRQQAEELKGQVLDTKAEIKAGVDDIKETAADIKEVQEAIGAIGDGEASPAPSPSE